MSENSPINLAISTDQRGFAVNATLIASVMRRASRPVHVRCWCRDFLPESFEVRGLKVEFLPAVGEVGGRYPGYVGPAVFDRLRVIEEAEDWDRCLVMDYDQVALCDLAPLFDLEMGDKLLAAKMQGAGVDMAYAMRTWIKRDLPSGWEHVGSYPYFSMGPLLNLAAMREAGTWEKLLAAHRAFGEDEQLSLTAASEGRTMGFERKWNLFPKSDIVGDEVPEGVVHWLGWPKPWHPGAKVWRPDIWESERASWEHLRMGIWDKPLSVELEPEDDRRARDLAARGWRVRVFSSRFEAGGESGLVGPGYPDLEVDGGGREGFQRMLEEQAGEIEQVRLGAWEKPEDWLAGARTLPKYLALQGGMGAEEVDRIRLPNYTGEARLMLGEWPSGGPLPRALEYGAPVRGRGLGPGEALYLKCGEEVRLSAPLTWPSVKGETGRRAAGAGGMKVGVCVIATANYRAYLRPLVRSIRRNFLVDHEVTVFVFSDGELEAGEGLRVVAVEHSAWPGMAIRRYPLFREHAAVFAGMDYLYYMDADMRVIDKVGEEVLGDLVGTLHPGFYDKPRSKFTYERRRESTAWIGPDEGEHYFCGAFQGGRRENFLAAVEIMAAAIDNDHEQGLVASWHDESHWNRYLIDHPPSLVLSPSYCWYADGRSKDFAGRIAVVPKDAAMMRK